MTQTSVKLETYRTGFDALLQETEATDPQWLTDLRREAWSRFNKLGFPTARRGNEKWKYTSVRPLAAANFDSPLVINPPENVNAADLRRVAPWNDAWTNLVFLDGHFAGYLSNLQNGAGQITVTNLADAIASAAELLMGEADEGRPAVLVRGVQWRGPPVMAAALIRERQQDLFR